MKVSIRAISAASLLLAFAGAPVLAQDYAFELGVQGGGSMFTAALDEDHLGAGDVKHDTGWLLGAQAGFWFTPRIGLRANGWWADRPLEYSPESGEDVTVLEDVNLWTLTGDLLFRLSDPVEGASFVPYIALGAGGKWVNVPGNPTPIAGSEDEGAIFTANGNSFFIGEVAKPAYRAALGGDMRLSRNMALRLELGDLVWDAPMQRFAGGALLEGEDEDVGNAQHEIYATVGLNFLFGVEPEAEVVTAAPPPPPAAPAAPQPVEERIRVCVIDPASGAAGIRTIDAIYLPATRDTVVVVDGRRVPIEEGLGSVTVAGEADWFVAGQPLTLTVGTEQVEFVTYGTSRIVERDLSYIGMVNGMPVYAASQDVEDIQEELEELRAAGDLDEELRQREDLREEFEEIEILYVPLQTVGCVFQPLQFVEPVRKGGN